LSRMAESIASPIAPPPIRVIFMLLASLRI
jgi:hypothetical protein